MSTPPKLPSLTESGIQPLRRDNPDILGAVVVDGHGNVRAADAVSPETVSAAVALVVPARELLERLAAELGCGTLRAVVVEGDRASVALADVDGASSAILIGQSNAAPGALRADALALASSWARGAGRPS